MWKSPEICLLIAADLQGFSSFNYYGRFPEKVESALYADRVVCTSDLVEVTTAPSVRQESVKSAHR